MASNTEYKSWLSSEDETIISLEKAQAGRTTLDDIADAIDEYKRLFVAGLASPAEKITLHRAFPSDVEYMEACEALKNDDGDYDMMIVGGPASVEVVDREGHLITTDALKKAFKKYMKNFRGRNVMVMHSDVQVGHALPAYISKSGNIFKSGVDDKGLFFIAELRDDTKISGRVRDQIEKGGMKSYSIAGSATQSKQINKSDGSTILQVDDMELAEVTICEKGVNQNAHFELLKGDKAEGSCVDGSCLTKSHDPAPDYNIVAISKSEIPSFKDMFTSWIAKEQDSDKSTAIAIATAQAKKMGYKKFTEGSPGDKKRDKLAKEIKRSLKSAKEKAITKTFLAKDDRAFGVEESNQNRAFGHFVQPLKRGGSGRYGTYESSGDTYNVGKPTEETVGTPEDSDTFSGGQQMRDDMKAGIKNPYPQRFKQQRAYLDEQFTENSITKTFLTKQPQDDNKTFRRIKAVGEGEAPIESDYTPSFGTLQTTRPNQLTSEGPGYKYDASTTYDAVLAGGDVPHGGETTSSGERKTPYNPAIYYGGSEDPRYKPDNKKLGTKTGDIGEGGTRYAAEKSITKQLFLDKLKEIV